LDALGVKNGPSHAEVIMIANGLWLVKMNSWWHWKPFETRIR
jgi:hypothetical protein